MEKEMSTITRQQAEIEKNKRVIKILEKDVATAPGRLKEKAMQKFDWNEYVEVEDIDNLVKELSEDGESNE